MMTPIWGSTRHSESEMARHRRAAASRLGEDFS